MSTRMTWAHELAARCRKVGWKVSTPRSTSGAYKVIMPPCNDDRCNHIMQMHLTSSDINAERTVLRELTAHGLLGAEKRVEVRRTNDKSAKMAAERLAAEHKANEIAKVARTTKMVNKAAGPYAGPEQVADEWYLTPHPAPAFKWVVMTPTQAKMILAKCNTDNRPLREKQVMHYMQIIVSGQWHQTHQGAAIDQNGVLQDGQHRLAAIVASGMCVPMAFFVGMAPENFKAIDEGMLRTAGQLFAKAGEANTNAMQATTKLIISFLDGNPRRRYRDKLTNEVMFDMFEADQEEVRIAAMYGMRHYKRAYSSPGAMAAAFYLIRKANGTDNPYVSAFFHGLVHGRKRDERFALRPDDPRTRLRELNMNTRTRGKRTTGFDQTCLIIQAWNYVIEGKTVKFMKFTDVMPVPRISLLPHSEKIGVVSRCPYLLENELPEVMELAAAA